MEIKTKEPIPVKVILVGESGVGKTCIINRYVSGGFSKESNSTMGATFSNKNIVINGYEITFQIWDTAGQEKYRAINTLFYKDAYICILVYDITRKDSLTQIMEYWKDAVSTNATEKIIFGLAGNKSDLYESQEITDEEGINYAKSINASFKLTSAVNNSSIDDLFLELGNEFLKSEIFKSIETEYVQLQDENNLKENNNSQSNEKTIKENKENKDNKKAIKLDETKPANKKDKKKCCNSK